MPKPIQHYDYLAQDRVKSLYQQIHKNNLLGIPIQASFTLSFFGFTIGKPAGKESPLPEQLQAVVEYLQRHQPDDIGTVDSPRKYIGGTLSMFSHFVPQGFGVKTTDKPEFVYYGGSTDTTIIGIAGPAANLVGRATTETGDMGMFRLRCRTWRECWPGNIECRPDSGKLEVNARDPMKVRRSTPFGTWKNTADKMCNCAPSHLSRR
jgi:hypothetical protein